MKVLIVSQPVLSSTNNMGKTLMGYFKGFPSGNIAQLFLRQGTPENAEVCERYYRFSDADAMKSIWNRSVRGTSFDKRTVQSAEKAAFDKGQTDGAYKMGAAHKAWMLLARDAVWKCSHWKNEKLLGWLKQIDPDVVFLAPGDGAFAYRVADEIAQYLHRPLVMVCMDDFFIHNRNQGEFLGNIRQRHFMKAVRKTMQDCAAVFTICDGMNKAYSALFQKSCFTLHTSADKRKLTLDPAASHLSYIGNLSCGRYQSLLEMGKALSEIKRDGFPKVIDVYSGSQEARFIEPLKNARGICFHGAVSAEQVPQIMSSSLMVIHTESFDPAMMELVRFSVSTKIAESLMYGPCLLAYGPEGIASIDYLKENDAAYVITQPDRLAEGLTEILSNGKLREHIMGNARALAARNHDPEVNSKKLYQWLERVIGSNHKTGETLDEGIAG